MLEKFAEKIEEEVPDKYKMDDTRGAYRGRGSLEEAVIEKQEVQNTKLGRRLSGNNFRFVLQI